MFFFIICWEEFYRSIYLSIDFPKRRPNNRVELHHRQKNHFLNTIDLLNHLKRIQAISTRPRAIHGDDDLRSNGFEKLYWKLLGSIAWAACGRVTFGAGWERVPRAMPRAADINNLRKNAVKSVVMIWRIFMCNSNITNSYFIWAVSRRVPFRCRLGVRGLH